MTVVARRTRRFPLPSALALAPQGLSGRPPSPHPFRVNGIMEPESRLSRNARHALRSLLAGLVLLFLGVLSTACRKPVEQGPRRSASTT